MNGAARPSMLNAPASDSGRMSDESLRQLQHELDLEERTLPGG